MARILYLYLMKSEMMINNGESELGKFDTIIIFSRYEQRVDAERAD